MASVLEWPLLLHGFRRTRAGVLHSLVKENPAGDLPPVVVLHGLSASAAELGTFFAPLAARSRKVIAIDLPGHGSSPRPALGMSREPFFEEAKHAIDLSVGEDDPAILAGNSLGGLLAIRYAHARPKRTRGLFLTSPGGAAMTDDELRTFLADFPFHADSDARDFVQRLFARKRPVLDGIVARVVRRRFARPAIRELALGVRSSDLLAPEEVATLPRPTLVAWGTRDLVHPPSHLAFFRQHRGENVAIEEPDGWTHCPHLDAPDAVRARLVAFAESIASTPLVSVASTTRRSRAGAAPTPARVPSLRSASPT